MLCLFVILIVSHFGFEGYYFDGKLFNLRPLQANSKVQTVVLRRSHGKNAKTETNSKGLWIEFH